MPYRNGTKTIIDGFYAVGIYAFQAYDENNAQIGFDADNLLNGMYAYRVVLIESSNTIDKTGNGSGKSASKNGKVSILNELKAANIDVNDYYSVCEYYGICGD